MASIEGQTIVSIHNMTQAEMQAEGWDNDMEPTAVLVLSNGVKLYASADYEGNDCGAIFGCDPSAPKDQQHFTVFCDK